MIRLLRRLLVFWLLLAAAAHAGRIEFDTKLREVDAQADAKTVAAEFTFTNRGDKPSKIRRYHASCSCMAAMISDGKLEYAPGESGTIRVNFDLGNLSGNVEKNVFVFIDDDADSRPSVSLVTRIRIPTVVGVEPKSISWTLDGPPDKKTVRITMNHSKPVRVTAVNCSSDIYAHQLRTIEEGKVYELDVTPRDTRSPVLGVLRIETDCDIPRHRIQQVFAVCRRPNPGEAPPAR
jgi:hypothetical protein